MRRLLALSLFALLGLSACRPQPAPSADPLQPAPGAALDASVWMVQTFSGGRQCQPREPYSPPNVAADLAREQIEVLAVEVEQLSVCQACSCPAYAARHFVQVRAADAAKVEALGYERAETPPSR